MTAQLFPAPLLSRLRGAALLMVLGALPAAAQVPGAPIFVGGEVTGAIDTFRVDGTRLDSFDSTFDIVDRLAVGDLDGDGAEEVVIAEDTTSGIDVYSHGVRIRSWDSSYEAGDALGVGDLDDDGRAEIIIGNNIGGNVDVFDLDGNLIASFRADFTIADGLAVGNVLGDRRDEIVIAGDVSGIVEVFDGTGGRVLTFDGDYTINDGLALGDLDGDGHAEILIAGDVGNDCDVFDQSGHRIRSFDVGYTISDGFAAGDVTGDRREEILVAGDVSGTVDVFDERGNLLASFDGDFSINDALAVGRRYDRDRDGLLDVWESFGYDADGDGTVDVPLPAMGARPDHKDLFLELDWAPGHAPRQDAVQAVKRAFALAPVDAGGRGNPDGRPGINLWIDTGSLMEGGELVGDNFGGGNQVPRVGCLDDGFYVAKANNLAAARRPIFRYAISADGRDSSCGGGLGEIGGNDFVEFNHDAGTLMHELGHNLTLGHGGNSGANCKPNYLSVMSYDHQFGIRRVGGVPSIIDYSPPRTTAGVRGRAPLPTLVENNLDESLVLDPTDHSNRAVFVAPGGAKVQVNVDGREVGIARPGVDWNSDGDHDDSGLTVNIDTDGSFGPEACKNDKTDSTLPGHDDWHTIYLPFDPAGDDAAGPVNPVPEREPTLAELAALERELNTTDLVLALAAAPIPAVAGTDLSYTTTVDNRGLNPASRPRVTATLPAGVSLLSSPGCTAAGAGLTCDLAEIERGARAMLGAQVRIPRDLVYNAGAPVTLTHSAQVENLIGPDTAPADNRATLATRVVAVADLDLLRLDSPLDPAEVLLGELTPVTVAETMIQHGPSAPMDVTIRRTAIAPAGSTATPASPVATAVALGLEEVRRTPATDLLRCGTVGRQLFRFTSTLTPARPDDTDPRPANDTATLDLGIECVVPVVLVVRSTINLGSHGVIPVEVQSTRAGEHGTPVDFDATTIDPLSIRFGPRDPIWREAGGAPEAHGKAHGGKDRTFHFETQRTGLTPGTTEACVKGRFSDGHGGFHKFFGCGPIRIVG